MNEQERAMQFGYLLSEIEIEARALLDGTAPDIMVVLAQMKLDLDAAILIAAEVSREALDKVTGDD